ncbi:M28 family peptidase [Hymenobacter sp. BT175]|uniref:M28 family metallopeptidase n=1 Tax=Hymenobacter translucens TaxID=2886507 RepID=UPI001D0DCB8F|nr:M28 family peptidase [Hymenobacter translucens]MCC2547233.1 M28 family peptidase [Hymenobacter translucens]
MPSRTLLFPGWFDRRLLTMLTTASLTMAFSPAAAQDMARVRQTIEDLTAPRLHGRGYVQRGDQQAADYLRQRFRAAGLLALTPNYTQPFRLTVNTFPGTLSLELEGTGDRQQLRAGHDFIAEPGSGGGKVSGPVVYLDTLVFSQEEAGRRFLAQSLRGKVVVLRHRDAERVRNLPDAFARHLNQAGARVTLFPTKLTASLSDQQQPQPQLQVLASRWPAGTARATIRVEAKLAVDYPTQNLIGYVAGSVKPDSFLVVTAHYDHLGRMGRQAYFPGANDNASGTAMLLELAAYYGRPEHRPPYSIVFIAFGGEEAGLLGSRYLVSHPVLPLERIRFLVNLDLLGTGQDGITVVNGRLHEAQYQLLTRLNAGGGYVAQLAPRGRAANSDHFPFSERGVPAFYFYTRGGSTAYHDVFDQPAALSLAAFPGVFALINGFLAALQPKP